MTNRARRCVFVAESLGLAEVVALWLTDQGIPAQVMDTATLGGLDGLSWITRTAVSARGIEVWVEDPDQIDQARLLLEQHSAALAAQAAARESASAPIDVVCEECGEPNTFPGNQSGKVENCTHCGAYIDVPAEGEDWAAAESEDAAGEDGPEEAAEGSGSPARSGSREECRDRRN